MSSSSQVVPNTPDVLVRNEGTVFLFCPVAWKLQRESGTRSSRQSLTNWHHSFARHLLPIFSRCTNSENRTIMHSARPPGRRIESVGVVR